MANQSIDDILAARKGDSDEASEPDKFFSTLTAEGYQENFLELRFRDGYRSCFAYSDLNWFTHDPDEGTIDMEFSGFMISIVGRGLGTKLFHSIKSKRAAWVKEADSDFQDNPENDVYIESILVTTPEGFGEAEEEEP